MRILILSTIAAPYRIAVFRGIAKEHEVTTFLERDKDGERNPGWFEKSDDGFSYFLLSTERGRKKYEEEWKQLNTYDAVLCYEPFTKEALALQLRCICHRLPVILNADGVCDITSGFPRKQIKSFFIKRAELCFAGSDSAERYFAFYGAKKERIVRHNFTSLYGKEILPSVPTAEEKTHLRKKYGLPGGKIAVSVGQFIPRKGFDLLLKAWKKTSGEDTSLLIIGGGFLKEEYLKTIKAEGIQNVRVLDYFPHAQLMELFCASDFYVMPTREDVWGLVVNEAMACGLPVISSDRCVAGMELIENGENGYIYPLNDTQTLAEYIDRLSADDVLRAQMGMNALQAIRPYTYERVIKSHLKAMESILPRSCER